MKTIEILLLLMIAAVVSGQEKKVYELGEVTVNPPKFVGVENRTAKMDEHKPKTINQFLAENVEYPEKAWSWFKEGIVVVQFDITATGDVDNIDIVNPVSADLDAEVIRVLRATNGMWIPGSSNEQHTAMRKEACVCFKLDFSSDFSRDIYSDFDRLAKYYFTRGAKRLFEKHNPKTALKAYDKAMNYRPLDKGLLLNRSYCKYALGDMDGARKDWDRIKELGGSDASITALLKDPIIGYELDPEFFQLVSNN